MGLYNLPRRDRILMRRQNRQLHRALRECLPRLLKPPQPLFELSNSQEYVDGRRPPVAVS